jgi:hypothetical protein
MIGECPRAFDDPRDAGNVRGRRGSLHGTEGLS